jgi:hypothetical protein
MIDVRNPLPGIVDAPVYLADGVTRVDHAYFASSYNSVVVAQLYIGEDESSLFPVGPYMPMGSGDTAGYWDPGANSVITFPGIGPHETICARIEVVELTAGPGGSKIVQCGRSQVMELKTADEPVPLTGLQSFRMLPPSLEVYLHEDDVVVSGWGYMLYHLEAAEFPEGPWTEIQVEIVDGSFIDSMTWFTAREEVSQASRFYRLSRH